MPVANQDNPVDATSASRSSPSLGTPGEGWGEGDFPFRGNLSVSQILLRLLAYLWASPTTALGLFFTTLALLTGGDARIVTGVLEVHGGVLPFLLSRCTLLKDGASAITLGHIVLARDAHSLDCTRPHERIHVQQSERWGPLFLPAYFAASLIALLRGRRPYLDNYFERQAYQASCRSDASPSES